MKDTTTSVHRERKRERERERVKEKEKEESSVRILRIRTQRTPTPTPTPNVPSAKVSGTFICFIRSSGTIDSHDSVRFASFLSSRKNCVKVPSCSMAGVIVCSQYICASRQEVDWNGSLMRLVVSSIAARVVPVDENTIRNARNANERSGVIVSFSTRPRRLSSFERGVCTSEC